MFRHLLLAVLLLHVGCSDQAASHLNQSSFNKLMGGMTLKEVEAVLGPNTATAASIGDSAVYQWTTGERDDTRSIVVTFTDGKLSKKEGNNLE